MIYVEYTACDGFHTFRKYKTIKRARKYAVSMVGENPEFGFNYAVAADGIGTIMVQGCTLWELFDVVKEDK